jgi:hypothetical protein
MQISAANILIASQQAAKAAPPRADQAAFDSALAKEDAAFGPLAFRQMAEQPAPVTVPAPKPMASAPKGSQVDIRV